MKKTLTVNLGGTVFHIDDDAYRLLDNYLSNLKLHFSKEEGAEEIVNDIENRISELFQEKLDAGAQVVTLTDVEEVIARMGKPEDFGFAEDSEEKDSAKSTYYSHTYTTRRKLYRDPDDKILGGVMSGLAAYMCCDVMWTRFFALILLVCGVGFLIPVYIICWILIPEARTATEKLSMRGEEINIENIGKTVTDGFERVANGVNDFIRSDKPRTFLQKLGDTFVGMVGFFLKACLVLLAIIFSPVLFVIVIVFVVLVVAIVAVALFGGSVLYDMAPSIDWSSLAVSPLMTVSGCLAGIAIIGIPLACIIYSILRSIFNWSNMASSLKWTLFILWILGVAVFLINLSALGWQLPFYGLHSA